MPRKKPEEPAQRRQAILTGVDGKRQSDVGREALREQLARLAEKYNILAFEEPNTPTTQTVEYIARNTRVPIANGDRRCLIWVGWSG